MRDGSMEVMMPTDRSYTIHVEMRARVSAVAIDQLELTRRHDSWSSRGARNATYAYAGTLTVGSAHTSWLTAPVVAPAPLRSTTVSAIGEAAPSNIPDAEADGAARNSGAELDPSAATPAVGEVSDCADDARPAVGLKYWMAHARHPACRSRA